MDNQILPAHEFFIYVQPARVVSDDSLRPSSDEQNEMLVSPVDLASWTRIDLVDTVAIYARLVEEQSEQILNS
jgi:hypothetical protein